VNVVFEVSKYSLIDPGVQVRTGFQQKMSFNWNSSRMQLKDFYPLCTINTLFHPNSDYALMKKTEMMFTYWLRYYFELGMESLFCKKSR